MESKDKIAKKEGLQVYELGYHILGTVAEENVAKEVDTLKKILASVKAEIISEDAPKLTGLAYAITKKIGDNNKKFDTAYFGSIKYEVSPEAHAMVKKGVENMENILRYIIVKTVAENTMYTPKAEAKLAKKKEEGKAVSIEEIDKTIDNLVEA